MAQIRQECKKRFEEFAERKAEKDSAKEAAEKEKRKPNAESLSAPKPNRCASLPRDAGCASKAGEFRLSVSPNKEKHSQCEPRPGVQGKEDNGGLTPVLHDFWATPLQSPSAELQAEGMAEAQK